MFSDWFRAIVIKPTCCPKEFTAGSMKNNFSGIFFRFSSGIIKKLFDELQHKCLNCDMSKTSLIETKSDPRWIKSVNKIDSRCTKEFVRPLRTLNPLMKRRS